MLSTAACSVMQTPELLSIIFEFSQQGDLAVHARVCKKYLPIALAILWYEVSNPRGLFSILAPMTVNVPGSTYTFSRLLTSKDWARFERYANFVRILTYRRSGDDLSYLSSSVFSDIAASRTRLDFLPKLRKIRWSNEANVRFLPMFLQPSVEELVVAVKGLSKIFLPPIFEAAALRLQRATTLKLSFLPEADAAGEPALLDLLSSLPKLQNIALPIPYCSPRAINLLSSRDDLFALYLSEAPVTVQLSRDFVDDSCAKSVQSSSSPHFPALRCLYSQHTFGGFSEFLTSTLPFHNLTFLRVDSCEREMGPLALRSLLLALADRCKLLRHLLLHPRCDEGSFNPQADVLNRRITFCAIQPIASLRHLVEFALTHEYPVWIDDAEFEYLFSNCTELKYLALNSFPLYFATPPPLTIGAVLTLTRHCPKLSILELFLDADVPCPSLDPNSESYQPFPLDHRIDIISFGLSNLSEANVEDTAVGLSTMLSYSAEPNDEGLEMNWLRSWNLMKTAKPLLDRWEKVRSLLSVIEKAKTSEQKRIEIVQSQGRVPSGP